MRRVGILESIESLPSRVGVPSTEEVDGNHPRQKYRNMQKKTVICPYSHSSVDDFSSDMRFLCNLQQEKKQKKKFLKKKMSEKKKKNNNN